MANDGSTAALVSRLEKADMSDQVIIEPLWKQVLSNKGAMAYMWQWFGDHPTYGKHLLPTYFEDDISLEATRLAVGLHIRKPIIGHEGVGVAIADPSLGEIEAKPSLAMARKAISFRSFLSCLWLSLAPSNSIIWWALGASMVKQQESLFEGIAPASQVAIAPLFPILLRAQLRYSAIPWPKLLFQRPLGLRLSGKTAGVSIRLSDQIITLLLFISKTRCRS